ncbi:MAG TPA: galactokinase [Chitinophagaceae bacterium]|nr:galactokinase [Chitinophagaceae bacterium]
MKEELQKEFRSRFEQDASYFFFCPGRVNLIGEHIDYNGGRVLPCAISLGSWIAVARNNEKKLRFHSLNFPEKAELHLQTSYSRSGKAWFNYPLGVVNALLQRDACISGMDLLYFGDLPIGAGLSSSASIEMATCFALNEIFDIGISRTDMAQLCKSVENNFIGVNSGIMDQFAVAMGKKDHALLLDCDTLEHEYIPFRTGDYGLVIINSNKKRELADSKYNERFSECGAALRTLRREVEIEHLCDLDPARFEMHRHLIEDPVLQKRALHVVTENARVRDAVIALQTGDIETFGKLLYASHESLREWYEVSGKELDTIVDFCKTFAGCAGARMTGAGFGGCAIALVRNSVVEEFSQLLVKHYRDRIGYDPEPFASAIGDGVRRINASGLRER